MFLLIFTNFLFSLTYVLIEFALRDTTPLVINGIRMGFAGILTIGYQWLANKNELKIKIADIGYFITTCFIHMSINFISETYALQHLSSLTTSMVYLLTPIFSSIIDYILNNNKLTYQQVILVILGTALSLCMIFINNSDSTQIDKNILSYALLLISIASSTLAWYRIKKLINEGYSLITINGYSALISCFFSFLIIISSYSGQSLKALFMVQNTTLLSIALLAIIGNIIGYSLYGILLKYYSITTIFLADATVPCITAYYNFIFFNRLLRKNYIVFFILFVIFMQLFNYYEKRKKY
jgi:drug/metabolite transporter (DMT)-like permease